MPYSIHLKFTLAKNEVKGVWKRIEIMYMYKTISLVKKVILPVNSAPQPRNHLINILWWEGWLSQYCFNVCLIFLMHLYFITPKQDEFVFNSIFFNYRKIHKLILHILRNLQSHLVSPSHFVGPSIPSYIKVTHAQITKVPKPNGWNE